MLDTPCSEVVWRVLATHYILHFPLHFPSRASPCAITFHLESTSIFPFSINTKSQNSPTQRLTTAHPTKTSTVSECLNITVLLEPSPANHSNISTKKKRRVGSSWNVMAHGDAREGNWRGNCRMQWVASTLHTISELGVSSITTADVHTSAASSRLNWRPPPGRFKWTRPFRAKD